MFQKIFYIYPSVAEAVAYSHPELVGKLVRQTRNIFFQPILYYKHFCKIEWKWRFLHMKYRIKGNLLPTLFANNDTRRKQSRDMIKGV